MADAKDVIGREMQITVTFQDADGKELETRNKKQRIHAAGQTLAFSISTRAENPEPTATVKAHYEVLAPLEFTGLNKWERPAFETVQTTKFGTGGDRDLASFQVKNPRDIALKGMDITAICRDSAGAVVGSENGSFDIEPNGTAEATVVTFSNGKAQKMRWLRELRPLLRSQFPLTQGGRRCSSDERYSL
ncbi:hypothetical protein [Bowdeniella nasicola]|nr:hypothetical protein [Bowdeniella nasicola]